MVAITYTIYVPAGISHSTLENRALGILPFSNPRICEEKSHILVSLAETQEVHGRSIGIYCVQLDATGIVDSGRRKSGGRNEIDTVRVVERGRFKTRRRGLDSLRQL
jgi:hypothetical protein